MKTKTKVLMLTACAILLVVSTVFATMAFLTSSDAVTNTFTVGEIKITLDEAKVDEYGKEIADEDRVKGNEYKLIPGHAYTKDPTIHVEGGSETCWLFAKIENGLGDAATLTFNADWTAVDGVENLYAYKETVSALEADVDVPAIFTQFTFSETADPTAYKDETIVVTAYAIQADGFDTAKEAWNTVYPTSAS